MSESKTPRTDDLMGNVLGRRVALDPEYGREQRIIDHARQLETELTAALQRAEKAAQNPCTCVPDGDDGTVAHLCQWHKKQFGKAHRMQNMADTLTVENILKLPPESLRRFIAHGIQESTARKKAEAERDAMREDAERFLYFFTDSRSGSFEIMNLFAKQIDRPVSINEWGRAIDAARKETP